MELAEARRLTTSYRGGEIGWMDGWKFPLMESLAFLGFFLWGWNSEFYASIFGRFMGLSMGYV